MFLKPLYGKFRLILIGVLLTLVSGCGGGNDDSSEPELKLQKALAPPSCDLESAAMVAHMYACAFSYPEEFAKCINIKGGYSQDDDWIKCSEKLINKLEQAATALIPRQDIENKAAELGVRFNVPEVALDVIDDMGVPSQSMRAFGQEMRIVTVLTKNVASGYPAAPNCYELSIPRQVWWQYSQAYPQRYVEQLREMLYRVNYWRIMQCIRLE